MGEAAAAGGGCEARERLPAGESAAIPAVMFAAGLLGNAAALTLLLRRRRRRRGASLRSPPPPFEVLLTALVVTDLLATCLTSPVVLAAYGRGRALRALGPDGGAGPCAYLAWALSFFALATLGCLGAMALERSLALGAPYLYRRLLPDARPLPAALAALHALAAAFCALPLLGLGRHVQYCPGTWCFVQTRFPAGAAGAPSDQAFALLYAALLLLLVLAVLLGNLAAIRSLLRLHRRGRHARRLARAAAASLGPPTPTAPQQQRLSVAEELDHLILLAVMTAAFAACSLPFTIRVFLNRFIGDGDYKEDLRALRLLSINSIIDPWIFTILRPPVLRLIRSALCCQVPRKPRERPPVAKLEPSTQIVICTELSAMF